MWQVLKLKRLFRWAGQFRLRATRPEIEPLTFAALRERRQEHLGVPTDRLPCRCPMCRRSRRRASEAATARPANDV